MSADEQDIDAEPTVDYENDPDYLHPYPTLEESRDGVTWLFAPWLLLFRNRLSFTIFEMLVLTACCGTSLGNIFVFHQMGIAEGFILWFLAYSAIHVHLMLFAWPLFYIRTSANQSAFKRWGRLAFVIVSQGLFCLFWYFIRHVAESAR